MKLYIFSKHTSGQIKVEIIEKDEFLPYVRDYPLDCYIYEVGREIWYNFNSFGFKQYLEDDLVPSEYRTYLLLLTHI